MSGEPTRRTQAQRRTETRGLLLDAALEQLVAAGLAGFTTTEVCKRSGMSQGALFKHFPSKAELLAAVAEHLFAGLRAAFEADYEALPASGRTMQGTLELLWAQMLDPRLAAAFELYTAARTDRELQARLEPVVRAHGERIEAIVAKLLDLGELGPLRVAAALAISAMQGLVLNQLALPEPTQLALMRMYLDALAALIVDPASPARAALAPPGTIEPAARKNTPRTRASSPGGGRPTRRSSRD